LELRNGSLAGAGARSTFRTLWCSAAAAIWTVDAASKAEPRIVKIVFRILNLLYQRTWLRGKWPLVCQRLAGLDGDGSCRLIRSPNHEAASKFIGQKFFGPNIRQANRLNRFREAKYALWTSFGRSGSMGRTGAWRENPMKKLVFAILLIASPAWAQTKLLPKSVTARADPCAPIGRTADGKLVYSMKCENLPAPPQPPPQAEISAPQAPEPEVQRSGFFGLSYERKRPGE
jgi:hypothetical protein